MLDILNTRWERLFGKLRGMLTPLQHGLGARQGGWGGPYYGLVGKSAGGLISLICLIYDLVGTPAGGLHGLI